MAVSTEQIRALRDWYSNPNLACLTISGEAAVALAAALEMLLGYVEGYDPKDRLPKPLVPVWLEFHRGEPCVGAWHVGDELAWWTSVVGNDTWDEEREAVKRWHPIGGGGA